jgi:CO/xanthine dehydrogenase FAD-binding subunit
MAAGTHTPIAGGTDLMVQLDADVLEPPAAIIDLWHLDDLRGISYDGYESRSGR